MARGHGDKLNAPSKALRAILSGRPPRVKTEVAFNIWRGLAGAQSLVELAPVFRFSPVILVVNTMTMPAAINL
jgi:hypothetical protein